MHTHSAPTTAFPSSSYAPPPLTSPASRAGRRSPLPPTSATQTAAARTQSRSRLREAPNQRAAPRPRRARTKWAPGASACALWALVQDSWRRQQRRGWRWRRWRPERATLQVRGRARGWGGLGRRRLRASSRRGRSRWSLGAEPWRRGGGLRVGSPKAGWGSAGTGGPVKKERLWGKELAWRAT